MASQEVQPSGITGGPGVQLGQHPLFQRLASLGEHRVFARGKEVADDLRERWETSDSPLVQRIQARAHLPPLRLLALDCACIKGGKYVYASELCCVRPCMLEQGAARAQHSCW